MTELSVSPRILTLSLVALADLCLGALVYWRYRAFRLLRAFAYNALAVAAYCVFVAGLGVIDKPGQAQAWVRALVFIPHLTVLTFFNFCIIFARAENRWTRLALWAGGSLFLVEILARATEFAPVMLELRPGQGWIPVADPFYTWVYLPVAMSLMVSGWALVAWRWRKSTQALERQQLALFFVALSSVILINIIGLNPDASALASLAPLLYAGILAYAITRRNLFDIELLVRRGAVLAATATVLACIFVLALLLGRHAWGGAIESNRFAAVITALVVALGYGALQDQATKTLNRWLGEPPLNPQEKLLDYALLISAAPRLDDFLQSTCRRLCQDLGVERSAIWIRDRTNALVPAAAHPLDADRGDPELSVDDPRIEALGGKPRGLDLDSLAWTHAYDGPKGQGPNADEAALRDLMQQWGFHAAVPLCSGPQLLGVLFVGPPVSGRPFKEADVGFLSTLALQLATAVQNSLLHRQVQQADRLSTLGTLSASLAHEIRNPLTSISTFVQMIGSRHQDPVFLEKFERIVSLELEKLTRLTEQLLSFARPAASRRSETELNQVAERVRQLLHSQFARKGVELAMDAGASVLVRANEAELSQVLMNLAINALQATPPGGKVTLHVGGQGGVARVRVADTGIGMSPSQLKRLFEPFFSTKDGGTGLGLTTCQRIVEEHGGKIEVESASNEGTCFTVTLPMVGSPAKVQATLAA